MSPPGVVRLAALMVLLAQASPLPAAVACTLRHRSPVESCEGARSDGGPSVGSPMMPAAPACAALPCVPVGNQTTPIETSLAATPVVHVPVAIRPVTMPASFTASPSPPPPEA